MFTKKRFLLSSFFVPLILIAFYIIFCGIFGKNILPVIYQLQQVAFLGYFKGLFNGTNSVFYSFCSGGNDMFLFSSMYLFSPWNFISFLFPDKYLDFAFITIISLKISLCSLAMGMLLFEQNIKKSSAFRVTIFYAFLVFCICFWGGYQILDLFYLAPFVWICLEGFIKENKRFWLSFLLILSVILNIYVGAFFFLLTILFFSIKIFGDKFDFKTVKNFSFIIILACLSTSVIWLPIAKHNSFNDIQDFYKNSVFLYANYDERNDFYTNEKFSEKYVVIEKILDYIKNRENGGFYRVETDINSDGGLFVSGFSNDGYLHGIPAVSQYVFVGAQEKFNFWRGLGLAVDEKRKTIALGGAQVLPMSFGGVKYLIVDKPKMQQPYKKIAEFEYKNGKKLFLFENPLAMPLSFLDDSSLFWFDYFYADAQAFQNDFLKRLSGVDFGDVYDYQDLMNIADIPNYLEKKHIPFDLTVKSSQNQYFVYSLDNSYFDIYEKLVADFKNEKKSFTFENIVFNNVFLGKYSENQPFSLDLFIKKKFDGDLVFNWVMYENVDVLKKYFDVINKKSVKSEFISQSHIKTVCDVQNDNSYLFFTLPYEKGWRAKIDGDGVNPTLYCGFLLSVPLNKGVHEIELFYVPDGFLFGGYLSVLALALLILL